MKVERIGGSDVVIVGGGFAITASDVLIRAKEFGSNSVTEGRGKGARRQRKKDRGW